MKNLIIATVITLFGLTANAEASSNIAGRVGGYFYASLSPHGTWIDIGYGAIAWKPTIMARTWQPYYSGRWMWTDYGWYWYSYEPFGHIVYHYGRWYYDDYYGWIWIPDYEWAPAWVEWRYSDSYIGWAPLSPYGVFSVSIGIHFTRDYYIPYSNWHYVHLNHFYSPYLTSYYVGPKYKYRVHSRTKYRTNYDYYGGRVRNNGIDVSFIEKRSGTKIRETRIRTVNDPREVIYDKNRDISRDGIRTFYADRDELAKEDLRNVDIKRSDRRSSLDLSKVELGSTRNLDREKIRKEYSQEEKRDVNRTDERRDINRERNNDNERKTQELRKENSRDTGSGDRIDRQRTDPRNEINRETRTGTEREVKKNDGNNRTFSPEKREETQRNRSSEIQKRQDINSRSNDNRKTEERTVIRRNEKDTRENRTQVEKKQTTPPQRESRNIERETRETKKETRTDNRNRRETNDSGRQNNSRERTR